VYKLYDKRSTVFLCSKELLEIREKKMTVTMDYVKDTSDLNGHKFVELADSMKISTDTLDIYIKFDNYVYPSKKLRVFSDGEESIDFTKAYEMASERDSHSKGVDEETDKLFSSLNRKVVKNKKALIVEAMESVDVVRVILADHKFGWYKSAGCGMCPCSPGFIADVKSPSITTNKFNSYRGSFTDRMRIESISIVKR
jgi:hypothetical protein